MGIMTDLWNGEPARDWTSGPWSLELRDDEFADIAYEGSVVLRSIRAVVRDRNWDTARLVVDRVDSSGIALTLHVHSTGLGSDLRGVVRAEVRGAGRLRVIADLEWASEFQTNRTGLVALVAGLAVGFYTTFVYAATWLGQVAQVPARTALEINTFAMALSLVASLAAGALSDRIGRRPVLVTWGAALLLVILVVIFNLIARIIAKLFAPKTR